MVPENIHNYNFTYAALAKVNNIFSVPPFPRVNDWFYGTNKETKINGQSHDILDILQYFIILNRIIGDTRHQTPSNCSYNSLLTINISSMSMFLFLLLAEYLESLLSLLTSFSVFVCRAAASNSLQGRLPTSPL